eukprot:4339473-Prymnesium_polylepis.1
MDIEIPGGEQSAPKFCVIPGRHGRQVPNRRNRAPTYTCCWRAPRDSASGTWALAATVPRTRCAAKDRRQAALS